MMAALVCSRRHAWLASALLCSLYPAYVPPALCGLQTQLLKKAATSSAPPGAAPETAPPPKDNTGKKVAAAVLLTSGNR